MTFHVFPMRAHNDKVDFSDLDLVVSAENEDDAVIAVSANLDFEVHNRILVLDSKTYETKEYKI